MKIDNLKPGNYIVAVSGGVDSMVLLDLLNKIKDLNLTVAHFNHGIRNDSTKDEKLVVATAKRYGLDVEVGNANLGPAASEEQARNARYKFLKEIMNKRNADALVVAHHQDDLIETALINILRGTTAKGLVSIAKNRQIRRPLLNCTKEQLIEYARANKLSWREDKTNSDEKHLRNYLRKNVLSKMSSQERDDLLENIDKVAKNYETEQQLIATLSQSVIKKNDLLRSKFSVLPRDVGNELLAYWLRENGYRNYDRRTLQNLNTRVRTGLANTEIEFAKGYKLNLTKTVAKLTTRA